MPTWIPLLVTGLLGGGGLGAVLVFLATRKRDRSADLAARWDDASELSQKMRDAIEREVERQVAPMRSELQKVKEEAHEIQGAFRTWVSAVWLWDVRGRPGDLPMPPTLILDRLGLGHFADQWPTEPPPKP